MSRLIPVASFSGRTGQSSRRGRGARRRRDAERRKLAARRQQQKRGDRTSRDEYAEPARVLPGGCLQVPSVVVEDELTWVDEEFGAVRRPRFQREFGPPVLVGDHLKIQARKGYRAAISEIRPGIYQVALVPEVLTRPEFGFIPLLATGITKAVLKVTENVTDAVREGKARRAQEQQGGGASAARPALPGPVAEPRGAGRRRPLVRPAHDRDDDLFDDADELGCAGCGGRCRHRGY